VPATGAFLDPQTPHPLPRGSGSGSVEFVEEIPAAADWSSVARSSGRFT
jgi:hypothetical protein